MFLYASHVWSPPVKVRRLGRLDAVCCPLHAPGATLGASVYRTPMSQHGGKAARQCGRALGYTWRHAQSTAFWCHIWSPIRSSGKISHRRRDPEDTGIRGGAVVTFEEVLTQAIAMLQRLNRVSYRALKRQFALDDAFLEDLKYELTEVQQLAVDHDGTVLVWIGDTSTAS